MRVQHVLQGKVDDEVTVGQDNIFLPDLAQIRANAGKRLKLAAENLSAEAAHIGKGRQELESAVLARHVPGLAVADVVKQALVVAVQHDADVCNARARHVGEHKVYRAAAPAERHGAGHAFLRQLTKAGCFRIGKDDTV